MKSAVLIAVSIVLISIACTYKSVGSQPVVNNNSAPKTETPGNSASETQETATCTLTLAGAPTINGLRLGLSPDEVLSLFPGSKDDPELRADLTRPPTQFGNSTFLLTPSKYGSKEKFTGISRITFNFLDGQLAELNIGYDGPAYPHVDKFVEKFLEGKNLPPVDQWAPYVGMDNQMKILKCKEFEVRVFAGGQGGILNYVLVKDLVAEKKLKDRRAKAKAQAQGSSSPTPKP